MDEPKPQPTFEESLKQLDEIVQELEVGELSLERSLDLFGRGVKLSQACRKQLEDAETKVEVLMKAGGDVEARPMGEDEVGQ